MKEIVIITNVMANDGAARVLSELSKEWIRQGHKVTVIQIRAEYFSDIYEMPDAVEIINVNSATKNRTIRRFVQMPQVIRILRQKENAVVLAFLNPAYLLCAMCSPFIKNKIVFSERNDPEHVPIKRRYRFVRNNLFRLADVCVFQTTGAKNHFCKSVQKKGVIIPNPMNSELPPVFEGNRRKAIVAVCRLDEQKNIPMLLRAFQKLSVDFPEYTLEIYGRGDLEDELKAMILSMGLEGKALLMGFTYGIFDKIRDAAMYVSSSDFEGISNSMLEALGIGIPVVCTDCSCGGERMYIRDGENGYLVPVGDADKMYDAMKKVLEGNYSEKKLYEGAYKLRKELSVSEIAQKWLDIF